MASSFILKTAAYQGRYLYVLCEQTKNVSANTSTVNWTLYSTGGNANNYTTGPTTLIINGKQVYYSPQVGYSSGVFPAAKGSTSGSLTIAHESNGSKSVVVSLSTAIYVSDVSTVSDTWTLDTIQRGAILTDATAFTDEQNPTITYTYSTSANATSLQACISLDGSNDDIAYRDIPKTSGTYTFQLTDEERSLLCANTQGSDTRAVSFGVRTVIGGTTLYSWLNRNFKVVNANPVFGTITCEDTNSVSLALTGSKYAVIKGISTIGYNCSYALKKGATIRTLSIRCGSATSSVIPGSFPNATSNKVFFELIDSRGNVAQTTETLGFIDYVKVSSNLEISKLSADGKISLSFSGDYFNGSFGKQSNSLVLQYRYKENNGEYSSWNVVTSTNIVKTGTTYSANLTLSNLNYQKNYTVQARAADALFTVDSVERTAVKTTTIFDWSETDFNFNVPIKVKNIAIDYTVKQGISNGWYYRKWESGKFECWKQISLTTAATNAWGALWRGNNFSPRQSYPTTFVSAPVEVVSVQGSVVGGILISADNGDGVNNARQSGRYTIARPASTTSQTYYLNFYVCGFWK